MKKKAIIVDLDGTLADITHRKKFLETKPKSWKGFNSTVLTDTLNEWCREIMTHMSSSYQIIIVSGRIDTLKEETVLWLERYAVPYDEIYMRKYQDYRDDRVVKREIYLNKIKPYYEVLFVLDDRAKVVQMWRDEGLICLQCDEGNF